MTIHLNISRRPKCWRCPPPQAAFAATGNRGRAWCASSLSSAIDQFDPALEKDHLHRGSRSTPSADGMGGPLGPVRRARLWWKEGGYLLFSDIHARQRRMKYTPRPGASTVFPQEKTKPGERPSRAIWQGPAARLRTRDGAGSSAMELDGLDHGHWPNTASRGRRPQPAE